MRHPFMAAVAEQTRRARDHDLAIPVSVDGARCAPARRSAHRARDRACGRRRGERAMAGAAALRRRQVVRRSHDVAGAGGRRRSPACAAWSSSAFPCIRPAGPGSNAATTSTASTARCSSSRARATSSPTQRSSAALIDRLGANATLAMIDDADHAFHVRRRSGSDDAEVIERIADAMRDWMTRSGASFSGLARPRAAQGLPSCTRRKPGPPLRTALRPACLAA